MQAVKTGHVPAPSNSKSKLIAAAILLIILIVASIFLMDAARKSQAETASQEKTIVTQSTLEEKYGLRVSLVAVTAAGGMVDLRLKMLDEEKAKLLLDDKENFPALLVSENNITLNAPEDTKSQEIRFEKGSGLYLLFPNAGNAVKPGSKVMILFGDIQLEPVVAQ